MFHMPQTIINNAAHLTRPSVQHASFPPVLISGIWQVSTEIAIEQKNNCKLLKIKLSLNANTNC